jgi:hypothetical protein
MQPNATRFGSLVTRRGVANLTRDETTIGIGMRKMRGGGRVFGGTIAQPNHVAEQAGTGIMPQASHVILPRPTTAAR